MLTDGFAHVRQVRQMRDIHRSRRGSATEQQRAGRRTGVRPGAGSGSSTSSGARRTLGVGNGGVRGSRVGRGRLLASELAMARARWLVLLAAALSTVLMLQSTRVFVSYLVWVVDQANRGTLALCAVAVYAATALALVLPKVAGRRGALLLAVGALVLPRVVLQVVPQAEVRLVLAAVAVAAWSWLILHLLVRQVDAVALGLLAGCAIDLALRLGRMTVDLPWMAGVGAHVLALLLALALVLVVLGLAEEMPEAEALRVPPPLAVFAIGPALVIYHLMSGNPGLAQVELHASYPTAAWWMIAGTLLGLLLAFVVLAPATDGRADAASDAEPPRGGLLGSAALLLLTAVLAVGLFLLFWTQSGLRNIAWLLGIAGMPTLLALAMSAVPRERHDDWPEDVDAAAGEIASSSAPRARRRSSRLATPTGMVLVLTVSLLLHVALIFIYYSSTGNLRWMLVAWGWLVVCAVLAGNGGRRGSTGDGSGRVREAVRLRPLQGFLAVVVGGGALLLGGVVAQVRWEAPQPRSALASEFVVFNWNIQSGFARDNRFALDRQADEIRQVGPGVVLLQEVQRGWLMSGGIDEALWLSQELGMQVEFGAGSGDGLWGNAMLTSAPIDSVHTISLGDTTNLRRAGLRARIAADVPEGGIWFLVTHLDDPRGAGETRLRQVEALLAFWGGRVPAVIAGDFNAEPQDDVLAKLREWGFIDRSVEVQPDFTSSNDARRIDYIFVSPELRFRRLIELPTWDSDHRPVVQHIDVRPE